MRAASPTSWECAQPVTDVLGLSVAGVPGAYGHDMSSNEQDAPVMAGSDDASNDEKLSGLIEQVDADHGDEGAAAMADHLRNRMDETQVEPETPGDLED